MKTCSATRRGGAGGGAGGAGGEVDSCCTRCCTLSTKCQRSVYFLVGAMAMLMLLVGCGSVFTGLQIAVQASSVPFLPNHHNTSHNHTKNHTHGGGSDGGSGSQNNNIALQVVSSFTLSPPLSPPIPPLPPPSAHSPTSSASSFSSASLHNDHDDPVPWKPVSPSNLQGAWFAYGAIGLGLFTVVISLAGLRGVQRLNKDLIKLFSCSVALDLVVHGVSLIVVACLLFLYF